MRLVCGVGVNDAPYKVVTFTDGVRAVCPFYKVWSAMLRRVYNPSPEMVNSYLDATVCSEWLFFSNFKRWMETQDWEGKQLDKDLLHPGNKEYSPQSCVFITKELNTFITGPRRSTPDLPVGVGFHKASGKFRATAGNLNGRTVHLGLYLTPEEAEKAYLEYKLKRAEVYAETLPLLIGDALIKRFK